MAKPFQIDITDNDRTGPGLRSAEKKFDRLGRPLDRMARNADRLGKGTGIGNLARGLSGLSGSAGRAAGGLAAAVEGASGLTAVASVAGWAVGGLAAAAVVAGAAGVKFGMDWAKAGGEVRRTAAMFGLSTKDLQTFRIAGAYTAVSAEAMDASLNGLGNTLNDARWGRNPEAQAAMAQLGLRLKYTKDGAIDTKAAMLDLAGAMEGKGAQTQQMIARIFGVDSALPFLRRGRAAVQKDLEAALKSGLILTDQQLEDAERLERKLIAVDQKWTALKRNLMGKLVIPWLEPLIDGLSTAVDIADRLGRLGLSRFQVGSPSPRPPSGASPGAGQAPVRPGGPTPATLAFWQRIERKEGGLDRRGRPLTSPKGAIGVMQMLPATAERTARKWGVPWDPQRFRTDTAYNRMLGRLHMRDLQAKYGGSQVLAAAAYNAGEGRLDGYDYRDRGGRLRHYDGWLKRFGDPRKGEISEAEWAKRIPFAETSDYVAATALPGEMGRPVAAPQGEVTVTFRGTPPGTTVQSTGPAAPRVVIGTAMDALHGGD